MTSIFFAQKRTNFQTNGKNIGQFFGLLLLTGYHQIPAENDYSRTSEDITFLLPLLSCQEKNSKKSKYFFI